MTRRHVIGTAGHVDHGKTALVHALTGVNTDRLAEEKRRGITIELGFAAWPIKDDVVVSIVDVPGHRKFVHTMVAGASGIELVLLVVSAEEGVMPQTREHVAVCRLLGIQRMVVVMTKCDRVDSSLAELAALEVQELVGKDVPIVFCSAKTGQGIAELQEQVVQQLNQISRSDEKQHARLAVDRVFVLKGLGTVVTGTLTQGSLIEGAKIFCLGSNERRDVVVRAMRIHDADFVSVKAPTRLAVRLSNVSKEEVRRGDVLSTDPTIRASTLLDVDCTSIVELKNRFQCLFYCGTAHSVAKVRLVEILNEHRLTARIHLHSPMVVAGGDRFVLRGDDVGSSHGAVLGGGIVLDAYPAHVRVRSKRKQVLRALANDDASPFVKELSTEYRFRPLPKNFDSQYSIAKDKLAKASELGQKDGWLSRLSDGSLIALQALMLLAQSARQCVAEHHQRFPLDPGMKLETLRTQLAQLNQIDSTAILLDDAIKMAKSEMRSLSGSPITVQGDRVRLRSFEETALTDAHEGALQKAHTLLREAGLKGVTEFAFSQVTQISPKENRAIIAKLVRDGVAIAVRDLWFDLNAVERLRNQIKTYFQNNPMLTIATFKTISNLGRRQAIPLLELFDREGITRRVGDDRVSGKLHI